MARPGLTLPEALQPEARAILSTLDQLQTPRLLALRDAAEDAEARQTLEALDLHLVRARLLCFALLGDAAGQRVARRELRR